MFVCRSQWTEPCTERLSPQKPGQTFAVFTGGDIKTAPGCTAWVLSNRNITKSFFWLCVTGFWSRFGSFWHQFGFSCNTIWLSSWALFIYFCLSCDQNHSCLLCKHSWPSLSHPSGFLIIWIKSIHTPRTSVFGSDHLRSSSCPSVSQRDLTCSSGCPIAALCFIWRCPPAISSPQSHLTRPPHVGSVCLWKVSKASAKRWNSLPCIQYSVWILLWNLVKMDVLHSGV